jgi:hypothetical protein
MAEFYGGVEGNRGPATRMGSKDSGFTAFAQTHESRITVDYSNHRQRGDSEDRTIAHITIGSGWTSGYRSRGVSFHPDEVVAALDTNDPKIQRIWQRIQDEFKRLDEEAPKAIARVERKRAKAVRDEDKIRKLVHQERVQMIREFSPAMKANAARLLHVNWDSEGFLEDGDMLKFESANLRYEGDNTRVLVTARLGWGEFTFDLSNAHWVLPESPEELGIQENVNDSGYGYVRS